MNGKKRILICDRDENYSKRLAEYLYLKSKEYDVVYYHEKEALISNEDWENIDILITSEEELFYSSACNDTYMLTDNKDEVGNRVIYKYQSAEAIRNSVINIDYDTEMYNNEKLYKTHMNGKISLKLLLSDGIDEQLYSRELVQIRREITEEVQNELILEDDLNDDFVYEIIDENMSSRADISHIPANQRIRLRKQIYDAIRRYDILSELLDDEEITEIMVNGYRNIFYERKGHLYESKKTFDSKEKLIDIIQKIVSAANRTVNMSSPIVDARLEDGSRVNVVLDPVSLDGPTMTIRRFPETPFDIKALISIGAIDIDIANLLKQLIRAKYNILISGGTGTGKTTFLNAVSSYIEEYERIITIEDSAELKIQGIKNLVRLETRNTNAEGCSEITVRDLIKTALRMRPDRIIVGEVRGAEAIDMLQAFNVGLEGSMSTIHANSADDAILRLETLILLNSDNIPLDAVRMQICAGVDIIVQLSRQSDFSRKLAEIREVTGMREGIVETNLLYELTEGKFIKRNDLMHKEKLNRLYD